MTRSSVEVVRRGISHPRLMVLSVSFMLLSVVTCTATSSLRLVQIVYRHGARTPSHTFPTDPYRYLWTEGKEMLTKLGMIEQYQLGRFLRQRYQTFLREQYHFNDTAIRSTDCDRTMQSAEAQHLGLYSAPVASDHPTIKYPFPLPQLVPIHTVPKRYDQLMKMTSPCPAYTRLWKGMMSSDLWKSTEEKHREFFNSLATVTGMSKVDLIAAFQIADPVRSWVAHNMTMPAWLTDDVRRQLFAVQDLKQQLRYHTKPMQRLRGGPMVAQLTANMLGKLSGPQLAKLRRFYGYSAHDSTVAALTTYLGIYNGIYPPFSVCLIIEMHQVGKSLESRADHVVRIYYRNETDRQPWPLTVPGCQFNCPLLDFIRLTKDNLPSDIQNECFEVGRELRDWYIPQSIHTHAWSWLISTAMAVAVLIFLCTMYKRYL